MARQQFLRLGLRLLEGGVAYRHVRRYVTELKDHYEDLKAESLARGSNADQAEAEAGSRLGDPERLAEEKLRQALPESPDDRRTGFVAGMPADCIHFFDDRHCSVR